MKTLVVEDDYTSSLLLKTLLSEYGAVELAVNGAEALRAFSGAVKAGKPFDLVCLDIMLPVMNGQEVLRGIRELEESADLGAENGVKIIMTSALSDMKTVATSFRGLCDAYLVKPIETADLVAHLRDFHLIN